MIIKASLSLILCFLSCTTATTTSFIQKLREMAIEESKREAGLSADSETSTAAATFIPLHFDFSEMDACLPSRLHFYPDEYDFIKLFQEDRGDLVVALLGQLSVVRAADGTVLERKVFPEKVALEALEHASLGLFMRLASLFTANFRTALSKDADATYAALIKNHSIDDVRILGPFLMEFMAWKPSPLQYATILTSFFNQPSRLLFEFLRTTHADYRFDQILPNQRFHLAMLVAAMLPADDIVDQFIPMLEEEFGCHPDVIYMKTVYFPDYVREDFRNAPNATEEYFRRVLRRIRNEAAPLVMYLKTGTYYMELLNKESLE